MYFCYVDESGDTGNHDTQTPENSGSRYFILVGVIIHASKWKISLNTIKKFRKQLAAKAYMPYDIEFHCAELIDPRKIGVFKQIGLADRWSLIRQFAEVIGHQTNSRIISVVIDKISSLLTSENYFTTSITKLYQVYDEFLRSEKENGIVLFDRTNEKTATTHVRKLMGTSSGEQSMPANHIEGIIEDPIFRTSADSSFIQTADVAAYTLKEQEFPITSRKKFNSDLIFKNALSNNCIRSTFAKEDGIIRI